MSLYVFLLCLGSLTMFSFVLFVFGVSVCFGVFVWPFCVRRLLLSLRAKLSGIQRKKKTCGQRKEGRSKSARSKKERSVKGFHAAIASCSPSWSTHFSATFEAKVFKKNSILFFFRDLLLTPQPQHSSLQTQLCSSLATHGHCCELIMTSK